MQKHETHIGVEERVARATALFKEGYNCAQAVVMAFDDVMEMSPEMLAKIPHPLVAVWAVCARCAAR